MSLKGSKTLKKGKFTMDLAPGKGDGGHSGVFGHIHFMPAKKAPKTDSLRLLQIVKLVEKDGSDASWAGTDEARRDDAMTTKDKKAGVEGGYFVDAVYKNRAPRTDAADAAVSPYYNEDYKDRADVAGNFEDGYNKSPTDRKEAVLRDFPGTSGQDKLKFSFETAAKAEDKGIIFGTVKWHFKINKGKVSDMGWSAHEHQSATFDAAVAQFDETFHNPGASTAPKAPDDEPTSD